MDRVVDWTEAIHSESSNGCAIDNIYTLHGILGILWYTMIYCGILWYTVIYCGILLYRALPRTCTLKVAVPIPAVVLTTQVYVPISAVVIVRGKEISFVSMMRIFNGGAL